MQRDRQGRLSWAIVLLIIAIACGVAFGTAALLSRLNVTNAFSDYRVLQLDSAQKIDAVSDGFVYYDGGSVTKVGADAQTKWSSMVGSGAGISVSDSGVASWIGQKLTLINGKNGVTEYSGNLDGEILSAEIGAQYTAVLLGPEHNSTIVLMETGGRRVDSITLSDQTVIDYGFFYNDTLFWVMTLDTNGTAPSCTVNTYRPGRRLVGSITDNEQVIYHVNFQSSQICVTGDTYIKVYNYNGEEEKNKRTLVYGWTLADADDESENPMMAFTLNGQYDATVTMQDVRMVRGTKSQIVRMPFGCTELIAAGDRVYGFSADGYMMVAQLGRQKVSAYQLPVYFDTVYGVADGNVAILGTGSTIYLVSLE